jgi:peptide/nickel transport system substrate-binding protein
MLRSMNRRRFLQALGAGALVLSRVVPARAATQGDRLVVAVGQWGIETPFAWRSSQSEKTLWDCVYDPLIMRDPKTFEYRPGLAIDWQPSADYKSWTFHLREGVKFHEDWGALTGEDVKFTVEQNLRPDVQGGSAPFFRTQLDRIEVPEPYTVVIYFKTPVWEVPSHFSQFVGYQNVTSKKYLESVGEDKAAQHPIGTWPLSARRRQTGGFSPLPGSGEPLAADAGLQRDDHSAYP